MCSVLGAILSRRHAIGIHTSASHLSRFRPDPAPALAMPRHGAQRDGAPQSPATPPSWRGPRRDAAAHRAGFRHQGALARHPEHRRSKPLSSPQSQAIAPLRAVTWQPPDKDAESSRSHNLKQQWRNVKMLLLQYSIKHFYSNLSDSLHIMICQREHQVTLCQPLPDRCRSRDAEARISGPGAAGKRGSAGPRPRQTTDIGRAAAHGHGTRQTGIGGFLRLSSQMISKW